jgi:hypothetical protein
MAEQFAKETRASQPDALPNTAAYEPIPISKILEHIVDLTDTISKRTKNLLETYINESWLPFMLNKNDHRHVWRGLDYGYVAPIIRIDMTALADGFEPLKPEQFLFEVETRPDGLHAMLGCASKLNASNALLSGVESLVTEEEEALLRRAFEKCEGFLCLNKKIEGDQNLADLLGIRFSTNVTDFDESSGDWWIRVPHPTEETPADALRFQEYANRSVTPITDDSDKEYLVHTRLARYLSMVNFDDIDIRNGLCVKPVYATRSNGVILLREDASAQEVDKKLTEVSKIYRNNKAHEYLIMPYIPAVIRNDIPGHEDTAYEVIWRLFLVWDPLARKYTYLTGITTANPWEEEAHAIFGSTPVAAFWPVAVG